MKKRSILAMIGLTIITLSVYQLYWLYDTRKEMVAKGNKIPHFLLLLVPFLLLIGVVFLQTTVRFFLINSPNPDSGLTTAINVFSVLFGIVVAVGIIPLYIWWWYHYSKAVESVTNGRMSFDLCFWLTIVLGFFGVNFIMPFLIQNEFNQIGDQNSGSYLGGAEPPYPKI